MNSGIYNAHEKKISQKDLENTIIDGETKTIWNPKKLKLTPVEGLEKGYRNVKKAYKAYVGQMVDNIAYKGFKPDKINKSGLVEVKSSFIAKAADKVWNDIQSVVLPEEFYLKEHLSSGLPCWVPVPEHRMIKDNQLVLTSFKVNVQIHSRSANCKWLQEIYHNNPAWIHPETAKKLLGSNIRTGDLIEIEQSMPALAGGHHKLTKVKKITSKIRLTEGIHPKVIALSFHCGHWNYGRYASGRAVFGQVSDNETIWWQQKSSKNNLDAPTEWNDIRGVNPNWIIPNTPARVSGQFRSNDTVVTIRKVG